MESLGTRVVGETFNFRVLEDEDSDLESFETCSNSTATGISPTGGTPPSLADTLEEVYRENRNQLLTEDGITITPLKVLKDICFDYGSPIEVITFEIHMPMVGKPGTDSVRHRVIMKAREYTGHGEAGRYRLACQLAAADLLEKVKTRGKGKVELYGLLPGCRTNPMIYQDLRELCRMENLASKTPSFKQVPARKVGSEDLYAFKCFIGEAETFGSSDSIFLAKRLAAKQMYEDLTGEIYPDDRTATGSGCLSYEDLRKMGINPAKSVRASKRAAIANAKGSSDDGDKQRRRRGDDGHDIHDDDYAEEEDNVIMMREQLNTLTIEAESTEISVVES